MDCHQVPHLTIICSCMLFQSRPRLLHTKKRGSTILVPLINSTASKSKVMNRLTNLTLPIVTKIHLNSSKKQQSRQKQSKWLLQRRNFRHSPPQDRNLFLHMQLAQSMCDDVIAQIPNLFSHLTHRKRNLLLHRHRRQAEIHLPNQVQTEHNHLHLRQ